MSLQISRSRSLQDRTPFLEGRCECAAGSPDRSWDSGKSGAEDLHQIYGDLLDVAVQATLLKAQATRRLARVTGRPEVNRVLMAAKNNARALGLA